MSKKKQPIDFKAPATKGDVEELALLTDKNFRRVERNMATKRDIARLEKKKEQYKQDIISAFKTSTEEQKHDLEAAHQDQLDIVAGKKDAPLQWKSIPRRARQSCWYG
ncbi:MAG: hypothetical protein AAB538_00135 [Patescibacteria group bacterium]